MGRSPAEIKIWCI